VAAQAAAMTPLINHIDQVVITPQLLSSICTGAT